MNTRVLAVCTVVAAASLLAACANSETAPNTAPTPSVEAPKVNADPSKGPVYPFPGQDDGSWGAVSMQCQGGNLLYSKGWNTLTVSPRDPQCPQPEPQRVPGPPTR